MIDNTLPATIIDDAGFESFVNTLKFADAWDKFDLIYDGKPQVPERLHEFTIISSNDPSEPYGLLLQMSPEHANAGDSTSFMGKKLLAKVRLS